MTARLFRDEALDACRHKLMGTVRLYSPPWRWLVIGVVAALTVAVAALLLCGSYTRRERVVGQVLPAEGLLAVTPPMAGTVTEIRVREGEAVQAGAPLMVVSAEVATRMGDARGMVDEQLRIQRDRLELDLAGQASLEAEAGRGLRQREAMLRDQLAQLGVQRDHRQRQADLAGEELDKLRAMRELGYASASQVAQQEAGVLEARARLQELARQRIEVSQQLDAVRQQQRELPLDARARHSEIRRKLAEVGQMQAENEARRAIILRAPQAGEVAALLATPGQAVAGGQTVASLLPRGARLEAQLMVPSRAIGFIREGAWVVLRYQAYPYQKFGQSHGRVARISRSALAPQDVAVQTGQPQVREQHYRVIVALDRQHVMAYGRAEPLRPGMALEADLLTDRRRLVEWVLEPLYALGRRAMQ